MQAVILAAGFGKRMGGDVAKGLLKVAGLRIVERLVVSLGKRGVDEFIVVTNERFKRDYEKLFDLLGVKFKVVVNPHPERGNGYSLYTALPFVRGRFVVVMSDHVYEDAFFEKALKGEGLIVDSEGRWVDAEEAMKVKVRDSKVAEIGKDLDDFDFFDTGFFVLSADLCGELKKLAEERDIIELKDFVARARLPVFRVDGLFWMDIDTAEDRKKAERIIVRLAVKGTGDGIVSRLLNRRISTRITEILVGRVTPGQVTVFSFILSILSAFVLFFSIPLGGILYQVSSILDGVDGEIARASLSESKIGGYIDSILDRVSDFAFLFCLGISGKVSLLWWQIITLAVFGSVMVSYSSERYRASFCRDIHGDVPVLRYVPGKRDERIFVTMLLCLFREVEALFLLLAVVTGIRVLATVCLAVRNHDEGGVRRWSG